MISPEPVSPEAIDLLLAEYDTALGHTEALWSDLTTDQVHWRADETSSAIGWHLGHQPAVAHFMVRNLVAAEPSLDVELDRLMDSATPPSDRGELPDLTRLRSYRDGVADRVRARASDIRDGEVGAPAQLRTIAQTMLVAIINHEYQHSTWIAEVRGDVHGMDLPPIPTSPRLSSIDGYLVLDPAEDRSGPS